MKYLKSVLILTLPMAITCVVPSRQAGTISEVDNKTLCGIIFEPDGKTRAQGASVFIRSRDYLSDLSSLQKRKVVDPRFVDSTRTNDTGYYRFDSVPYGLYCIEGRDSNNNCVLIDSIAITVDEKHQPMSDTLKLAGAIKGTVSLNGDSAKAIIRVFGLNAYAKADSGGNYLFENLPAGNMRLQILMVQGSHTSYDTITVEVKAGDAGMRKYKVTFDSRGGSSIASQLADSGDYARQPSAPTDKAVSFAGWFKEPACSTEWHFANDKVTAPATLYAKWIVRDVDGNVYSTVRIGNQVWLTSDLKTTSYNDLTAIHLISDSTVWDNVTVPAYGWYYDYKAGLKAAFGPLYNWYAVNTGKLAPQGWHVSTDGDWDTLQNTLLAQGYGWDGITGITIVKALAAQSNWDSSENIGAIGNDLSKNNGSGFSALPGLIFNWHGCWWTTSEFNDFQAVSQTMSFYSATISREPRDKKYACSVRCIRDE
jgi:uncharacterized protein (TIGR02145 family)